MFSINKTNQIEKCHTKHLCCCWEGIRENVNTPPKKNEPEKLWLWDIVKTVRPYDIWHLPLILFGCWCCQMNKHIFDGQTQTHQNAVHSLICFGKKNRIYSFGTTNYQKKPPPLQYGILWSVEQIVDNGKTFALNKKVINGKYRLERTFGRNLFTKWLIDKLAVVFWLMCHTSNHCLVQSCLKLWLCFFFTLVLTLLLIRLVWAIFR